MVDNLKKNIIVITSAIVGLFIFTWLCVRFINNDIIPDHSNNKENNQTKVDVIKGTKTEKVELNGKENIIVFNAVLTTKTKKDKVTEEEYTEDVIEYRMLFNGVEVKELDIDEYAEEDEEDGKVEINDVIKKIKGKDNKDYLIVKLVSYSSFGTTNENVLIINDKGELLFKYLHEISSVFYEVKGTGSNKYIIGSNNCEDFKYIDTGESLCKDFDKLYSTYVINENNINFIECYDSENPDGRMIEKELTISSNIVTIKNTSNKYEINDAELSGSGFNCPVYMNLSN